jgi:hypothetical protein
MAKPLQLVGTDHGMRVHLGLFRRPIAQIGDLVAPISRDVAQIRSQVAFVTDVVAKIGGSITFEAGNVASVTSLVP